MITKLAQQLIKEAARWMDFVQKLSPQNYERLMQSGIVKSEREIINGINRCNQNLAKKYNYKIEDSSFHNPKVNDWIDAYADPRNRTINTQFPDPVYMPRREDADMLRALSVRHELYEAQAAEKVRRGLQTNPKKFEKIILQNIENEQPGIRQRYGNDTLLLQNLPELRKLFLGQKNTGMLIPNGKGKEISGHLNLKVLLEEKKLFDRNPYLYNRALRHMKAMRRITGENQFLEIAGKYKDNPNKLERFNEHNARNVLKNGNKPVTLDHPVNFFGKQVNTLQTKW